MRYAPTVLQGDQREPTIVGIGANRQRLKTGWQGAECPKWWNRLVEARLGPG